MSVKKFAYLVVESTEPSVPIGTVLVYTRGRGPVHTETVFDSTATEVSYFTMEKVGPCWAVGGKVQFEKPPEKSGELTREIMARCKAKREAGS